MPFGGVGPWELILILLVVLLVFGAKRLPEIGSSLGKGIREFKRSVSDIQGELQRPEAPENERRNVQSTPEPRGTVPPGAAGGNPDLAAHEEPAPREGGSDRV